jgi:peptidoglycan/LPS O-acetylase OafA/YrhL
MAERRGTGTTRLVGLDLLRLLAIVLVLGRHLWAVPDGWPAAARTAISLWQRGGWVGVDLFFVLSGFLVSGLLFAEFRRQGRISPLRFFARRAWKIYPPYLVMLAVTTAIIVAQGFRLRLAQLVPELLFFQNYVAGVWNHTWSLAVEEHFYLLLPLVCLLALRVGRGRRPASMRPVVLVGVAVAVGELALRVAYITSERPYSAETHLYPTHLRLDSLFFGVMLGYAYHFHRERLAALVAPRRITLLLGGGVLLAPAFAVPLETSPLLYTIGLTTLYVGSGMLVLAGAFWDGRANRVVHALAALGAASYSIYLWHMPLLRLGIPMLERMAGAPFSFGGRMALYLGGSLVVGMVMARLVEAPVLRLRDRFRPTRGRVAAVSRPAPVLPTPARGTLVA